ncbi:hypothetical protein G7K_5209-t1 [Saitoella complicata NRRL Y-17804]|uniref:Uncharacterized protein n=1 Tax=Saitoella complicata (strain BCRC 22490 / CBS 7301 / JCM 7358 / NBRC 10748 / NRRL Y-17804) TaxID=698492 RepID=A0A0E9NMS0_SAICN|nr:hypothetical protein G7K_5209-t1 [Saitoella complicata NRRL Y-17804]
MVSCTRRNAHDKILTEAPELYIGMVVTGGRSRVECKQMECHIRTVIYIRLHLRRIRLLHLRNLSEAPASS